MEKVVRVIKNVSGIIQDAYYMAYDSRHNLANRFGRHDEIMQGISQEEAECWKAEIEKMNFSDISYKVDIFDIADIKAYALPNISL